MSFPGYALLAEEYRLWILTTMSKDVPKMTLSTRYHSLPKQFLLSNAVVSKELNSQKVNGQVQRSLSRSPYTTRLHWSWCGTGTAHAARSGYPPFVQSRSARTIAVLFALPLQDHCALCRTVRTKTKTVEQNWTNRLCCFCHRYQCFFTSFMSWLHPFPN